MNTITTGYDMPLHSVPTKRYCLTLDLKNDPEMIAEYKKRHSPEFYWKEIGEGIREVGILDMEIFILENRLFMIMETVMDFDFEEGFAKMATLPRQDEWQEYMSMFMALEEGADTKDPKKWNLMERIYLLP